LDKNLFDGGEKASLSIGPSKTADALSPSTRNAAITVCAPASDYTAYDRGDECRAGCGHSGATGRSSRRIHRETRTAAPHAPAADRATAAAAASPRPRGAVHRRGPVFFDPH